MRRIFASILLTIMFGTGCASCAPAPLRAQAAPTLKLISWNIHNNRDDAAGVLETLRSANADVVLLQEVSERDFPMMQASLGYPHAYFAPDLWAPNMNVNADSQSRGLAILSRLPLRDAEPIPIGWTRGVWATVDFEGKPIVVASVHLSATWKFNYRHVIDSFRTREREITRMLNAWTLRDRPPLLMAGDFNNPPAGAVYAAMTQTLRDAHRELDLDRSTVHHGPIGLRIDYFLCSKEWTLLSGEVLPTRASDHAPITLTVSRR